VSFVTAHAASEGTDLRRRLRSTEDYLRRERFRGYDPYDALMSPLFRVWPLRAARLPRLAAQQTLKRLPVNIRPVLGIRKGLNPVTVALVGQAHACLSEADPERSVEHRARALECMDELRALRSRGYAGDCWGYDFDWEARYARFPAGTPTVVATGFVTNALFTTYEILGSDEALAMCRSACDFVRLDLRRLEGPDGLCWSYSTHDREAVLNASMKGARLCAQVYSITREDELRELASEAVRFVVAHQREDGSWPYAVGDSRAWADNFHTGYILDALHEYERCTGDKSFAVAKARGWHHYRHGFFARGFVPKYFSDRLYPIDATSCAQSVLTLCRFGDVDAAARVATWTLDHMQQQDGSIAYQIRHRYVNRIVYVRWSVAWVFAAIAYLCRRLAADGAV
jgi:hypothetical protein